MTSISPAAYVQAPQAASVASTTPSTDDARRRRRAIAPASHAAAGVAELRAPEQQLPFSARVGVSVRGRLLYPIVGAVLGTLLLGLPGTFLGAGVGLLLA